MPENETKPACCKGKCNCTSPAGAIYGLGLIGAAVYYIQHATSFGLGVLGLIKAIGWPAVVLYKVLELLKM